MQEAVNEAEYLMAKLLGDEGTRAAGVYIPEQSTVVVTDGDVLLL